MNTEDLLHAQRRLRGSLLESRRGAPAGSADLAAHLLLYLDDTDQCWRLILQWMRDTLDADRVDGGFASPRMDYRPAREAVRAGLPPLLVPELVFDPADRALRTVWDTPSPVLFDDVANDARFGAATRAQLLAMGTRAKLALALRDGEAPLGLICCNWADERRRRKSGLRQLVGELSSVFLNPILATVSALHAQDDAPAASPAHAHDFLGQLTQGELDVARLVVTGMSYKEIADRLNRSYSTVDHRLRSIREKSGARSTARMISMLSSLLAGQQPQ